jgi:hypothetical protein
MKEIPSNRVRSHADFDLTPLGMWAKSGDAATLTPCKQYLQYLNKLPNPFGSGGLDKVRGNVSLRAPRLHDKPA